MGRPIIIVVTSGGFDPVTDAHIDYLRAAKSLGDWHIVLLNSDAWLIRKKGYAFQPFEARRKILLAMRFVNEVLPALDDNDTVADSLYLLRPTIFAKGGDRTAETMPLVEVAVCEKVGTRIIYGVGGEKAASSSELVRRACAALRALEK